MSMNQDEPPVRPDNPAPAPNYPETPAPAPNYPEPPAQSYPENPPAQQAYEGYQQQGGAYAGPPQQGGAYAGPPPARAGFDWRDLLARWRSVLYPPSVASFDEQKPAANWNTILIALALLGVVQGVFAFITGFEYHRANTPYPGVGTIIGGIIGVFFAFFIVAGIIYLLARALGGTGSFLEHSWLLSLVFVPIQAVSDVAGVIPFLGGLVGALLGIYSVVLYVFATASAHRMTLGRATVAVLIPGIVLAALVLLLLIFAAAFLIALGLTIPGR